MLVFIGLNGKEAVLIIISFLFIPVIPLWTIFKKSGQNPLLSLLAIIPGLGVILALFIAAFSDWQTERKED